jgi:hypothetical protein
MHIIHSKFKYAFNASFLKSHHLMTDLFIKTDMPFAGVGMLLHTILTNKHIYNIKQEPVISMKMNPIQHNYSLSKQTSILSNWHTKT